MKASISPGALMALVMLVLASPVFAQTEAGALSEPIIAMAGVWDRAAPLIQRASREAGIDVAVLRVRSLMSGCCTC